MSGILSIYFQYFFFLIEQKIYVSAGETEKNGEYDCPFFLTGTGELAGAVMDFTNLIEAEQWIFLVKLPTFDQGRYYRAFVNICKNWLRIYWIIKDYISQNTKTHQIMYFSLGDKRRGGWEWQSPVCLYSSEYHWYIRKVIVLNRSQLLPLHAFSNNIFHELN